MYLTHRLGFASCSPNGAAFRHANLICLRYPK